MSAVVADELRVFLCDDTPEVRRGVRRAFGDQHDLTVVGEADDPVDGLPLIENLQPDVVVLDLSMPRMDGLEAIQHIAKRAPNAGIVVFSGFLAEAMGATALAQGADRYVEKSAPLAELATAVRDVAQQRRTGERPSPPPAAPRPAATQPRAPARAGGRARAPLSATDDAHLPGDEVPTRTLALGSIASISLAFAISAATGVFPVTMLVLYVLPVLMLATRLSRPAALVVAILTAVVYAGAATAAGAPVPAQAAAGVMALCVTLALVTQWTLALVRERTAQRADIVGELRRSNAELEQFAYVASHDLAAPLRTVNSFAGRLQSRYEGQLDAEADSLLGFITDGTRRMQLMIDDLLAFARAGRIEHGTTPFELADALERANQNLGAAIAERGARVLHGSLPAVCGDEGRIVQVLQNLIANAVKFCPEDRTPLVEVSAVRLPSAWRIDVRDNGIGIDPRYVSKVFGMFERLHPAEEYPGTGIGLAICMRIVERHGGHIWVDGYEGEGSTFSFTLPDPAP